MSTTEATIAENTASPAIEPDALSDENLAKVFAEPSGEPDGGEASSEPEGNAADAARQLADASEGKTPKEEKPAEGIDLSLLTDEPEPEAKPEDDPYIKTVKEFLPNETAVRSLVEAAQKTTALQSAIQSNDFRSVYQALGPNAEPLLEMFYQAAKDKLVERYINEAQGQTTKDPEVIQLKQQLAQLTGFIQNGVQQQQQVRQTEAQRKAHEAINAAIERDLTTARFPDDKFHKVQREMLRQSVIADLAMAGNLPKALGGDMKLVRSALKARLTALVEADKERQSTQTAKRTELETKKPIIAGADSPAKTPTDKDGQRDYLQEAADWLDRKIKKGN